MLSKGNFARYLCWLYKLVPGLDVISISLYTIEINLEPFKIIMKGYSEQHRVSWGIEFFLTYQSLSRRIEHLEDTSCVNTIDLFVGSLNDFQSRTVSCRGSRDVSPTGRRGSGE